MKSNLTREQADQADYLACSEGIEAVLILKDKQWFFQGVAHQTEDSLRVLKALRESVKTDHSWSKVSGSKVVLK